MKCQILFSGKNKKKVVNLSSAEFSHSTESVKMLLTQNVHIMGIFFFFEFPIFIFRALLQ